ncbi:MAG: PAS domain-containing protein [Polyangiaceae bacterium]|nr:PAS domain-containing protein [Polyangiaceae bacterium]
MDRLLAVAQEITHTGSWEWDVATGTVRASNELFRIVGLEPQSGAMSFEIFLERLHPDDRVRIRDAIDDALRRRERFQLHARICRPDGTLREIDTVGEAVCDDEGGVASVVGTCRDVTDERRRDETLRLYADIVRNVQIGLTVWEIEPDGREVSDAGPGACAHLPKLLAFNPAAEAATQMALAPELGKTFAGVFPFASETELPALLCQVRRDGMVRDISTLSFGDRTFAVKAFRLPNFAVGAAFEDVTAATRSQRVETTEQRVFEMIASGAPLASVLRDLVLSLESQTRGLFASVLLLDVNGVQLRHAAGPSLPEAYNRVLDGIAIGPTVGSCGTAAFFGRPVIVSDTEIDPLWEPYRDIARTYGLRACWSTPILATSGRVLGTFAVYYREPREPSPMELQLVARASYIARIAIERHQLEEQLRALSAHIERVREDERASIAREIHDELGQALTAIKLDLGWIMRRLARTEGLDPTTTLEKLRSASDMTDEVVKLVRRISAALRPGVLDDLGLRAAIEWQSEEFEKRTGTRCTLSSNVSELPLDRDVSTNLFRIFQEALTNVARHARANAVEVELKTEEQRLSLVVRDDGRGISADVASHPRSLGLLGIRERARRIGGVAVISGEPRRGTRVTVSVPLDNMVDEESS